MIMIYRIFLFFSNRSKTKYSFPKYLHTYIENVRKSISNYVYYMQRRCSFFFINITQSSVLCTINLVCMSPVFVLRACFICFSQNISVLRGTEISEFLFSTEISVPLSTENLCEKEMKQAKVKCT
jgi:hypothetical protein